MVLSRNDKRKRKEGDLVDLMDPLSDSPKRTKIHAQRKFAQGAATFYSPSTTPVKEKEKEKSKPAAINELISHKRPNTEDFLTFLCFRGTSILPSSLNFFNVCVKKEKNDSKSIKNSKATSSTAKPRNTDSTKSDPSQKAAKSKNVKEFPNGLKNTIKFKTKTSTVQALKRKYQEQRLAKQRIKNKIRTSYVIRTRSNTEKNVKKSTTTTLNKLSSRKFTKTESKRHGLRSGGLIEQICNPKIIPKNKRAKAKKGFGKNKNNSKDDSLDSDSMSNDEDLKSSSNKKITAKSLPKKIGTRKTELRRVTRSFVETKSQNLSRRPTRKTKEAAAVYMEILGRKLVSPDLENEDDISLDSFPELPNSRRILKEEFEIKEKVKQNAKSAKEKEIKLETSTLSSKRIDKLNRTVKTVLKSKRIVKVQKYCELETDEESEISCESEKSGKTRPMTRRSLNKTKPTNRSLRSSARNLSLKLKVESCQVRKFINKKEKILLKRKQIEEKSLETKIVEKNFEAKIEKNLETKIVEKETKIEKNFETKTIEKETKIVEKNFETKITEKENPKEKEKHTNESRKRNENLKEMKSEEIKRQKSEDERETKRQKLQDEIKIDNNEEKEKEESDEETLGSLLSKIKRKRESDDDLTKSVKILKEVKESKMSDDEESFRGFTKKAISKVLDKLDTCQSHVNSNLLVSDSIESKSVQVSSISPLESPNLDKVSPQKEESPKVQVQVEKAFYEPNVEKILEKEKEEEKEIKIIDMPSTTTGRKERVNMSAEQIEKWLTESSIAKEENKVDLETTYNYEKPKVSHHLSISSKIQHLVRPVNVTLAKLHDKSKAQKLFVKNTTLVMKNLESPAESREVIKIPTVKTPKESADDDVSKSDNSPEENAEKKGLEKKTTQRKLFLPKVKERKSTTPSANAFSPENESSVYAFESDTETPISTPFRRKNKPSSPTNKEVPLDKDEQSGEIYEKIEKIGERNVEKVGEKNEKIAEKTTIEKLVDKKKENTTNSDLKGFPNLANIQVLSLDKLTTNWSNVNCSASIAVQVNLDQNQKQQNQNDESELKSTEISTQTERGNDNDDDNDGQLFYIPLQAVTRNGSNLVQGQQLIQGVAVKLGTEGPTGPNQRVLLKAKLVTKPTLTVARVPPVGTVQPTARAPPIASTSSADFPVASTSTLVGNSQIQTITKESSVATSGTEKITKATKVARERKMSAESIKHGKRFQGKSKQKIIEVCTPINSTTFPGTKDPNEEARLVEAPTFHPSEKDFQDPLEYIDKIRPIAEKFGICRVIPPPNFKPECKVSDDMRFTAYNQYVHRMLHRWGPNVKEMMAIRKYLATQSITLNHPPWIGGMEVDLPHLYQTVQSLGGLKEVIEKKKWQKVADGMKIPRSAQDRVTKLDDIYCKYLLPYDTLSQGERDKLFEDVELEWTNREAKGLLRLESQSLSTDNNDEEEDDDSSEEIEECIVKGRNMPLNAFYRIARNTQRMWFADNQRSMNEIEGASAIDVESAFWKHVTERKRHVCVHAASIDSSGRGFGFSVAKNSPFARHPWNLKVLTNNAGSVLRALGPLMGVTVPTLHVGMLFSACCWYRDPHGLPWIEYLHTGGKKIWYGIPDEHNNNFRNALAKMVPRYCKNKTIWLPSDTAMVPPELLVKNGVPLCQTVQEPGQFIVVFPKAFTSSICTGYVVSESVYFAQSPWLEAAEQVFKDIQDSCEPSIFSLEKLLFSIINDTRSHIDVLKQILPTVKRVCEREIDFRRQLKALGLTNMEKLPTPESGKRGKSKKVKEEDGDFECETCRSNLFVSLVTNSQDDSMFCLPHAIQLLTRKKQIMKNCVLMITYSEDELDDLIHKLEDRIEAKSKKNYSFKQNK